MTRPCWYVGLALLVGCLIGAWLPTNVLLMTAVGSILVMIVCVAVPLLRRRRGLLLVCFGICAALLSLCTVQLGQYIPMTNRVEKTVTLQVRVLESDSGVYLTVIDGDLPRGTRLQLWSYADRLTPEPYDVLEGTFTLCDYAESGLKQLRRKAVGTWFAVRPLEVCVTSDKRPRIALFSEWRQNAVNRIGQHLFGDRAALIAGICFGADEDLSEQAQNVFRACGISHLFSVSGFHMALLSQALLWLLERLRLSRRFRAVITAFLLVLFMALVGTEPSVIRSGVLCLLMLAASCFRRQADTRNSLGLALILLLIADPFAAYDAGLLLSFFATFGLVLICPWLFTRMKRILHPPFRTSHLWLSKGFDGVVNSVCLTVSATLATLPISLLYFGEISLVAVLSNLLVSLPSSALLIFGLVGCVFVGPLSVLGTPFFFLAGWISQYLLWIAEKISKIPLVTVAITAPYLLLWGIGMVVLLLLCYRLARRNGLIIAVVTGVATLVFAVTANTVLGQGTAAITAVPTKGDTAVYLKQDGKTVLICAPEHTDTLYRIRTALRLDGITQLDVLIVPHGDESVLLTMTSLLEEYWGNTLLLYNTENAWLTDFFSQTQPLPQEPLVLWNDVVFESYGQHCRLAVKQTDLLLFTDDSTIRSAPLNAWASEIIVFGDGAPEDAMLLQGQLGIAQGDPYALPSAASCGVERLLTVTDDRLTVLTRGASDITYR